MYYKVKEVAELGGVSIRTLHHYDKIGLLKPDAISPAGYRLYTERNLEHLQQILFFKELDFSLQVIKAMINSPSFDRKHALSSHKDLLIKKKLRLEKIISSIDNTIETLEGGKTMNKKEMFTAFDMTDIEQHKEKYAQEVKEKYGKSEAYKESEEKTSKYSKEDWAVIMQEGSDIYKRAAALMNKKPSDPKVQETVGDLRKYITKHFYNCTPEIFRGLGDMYVQDERFTKNIDQYKEGLAKFLREAMHRYCDNL